MRVRNKSERSRKKKQKRKRKASEEKESEWSMGRRLGRGREREREREVTRKLGGAPVERMQRRCNEGKERDVSTLGIKGDRGRAERVHLFSIFANDR